MGSARSAALLLASFGARAALGHDVFVDVSPGFTARSDANPRSGSVSVAAGATWEPSDAWAVFGSAQYTRDFGTRTEDTTATGSNIVLLSMGASWAPSEHLLTMVNVTGSPPARQLNATTVSVGARATDVVLESEAWSLGGLWTGAWMSGGTSSLESAVDVVLGASRYEVHQRLLTGDTARGQALRNTCATAGYRGTTICRLVAGLSTPLYQGRLGAGYTATLFEATDVSLSATYYLYDKDPNEVGYFSLVALGRAELGNGVPILPLQVTLRPAVSHRVGPLTLRVAYQLGVYQGGDGLNHAVTGRVTWKASRTFRLYLSLTGQFDTLAGAVVSPGGNGVLGALLSW